MIISPHYEAIKARAIALSTAPEGFNGPTADEIMSCNGASTTISAWRCARRATIDPVTLCRVGRFNIGNFNKAAREIARHMKERGRHESHLPRSTA